MSSIRCPLKLAVVEARVADLNRLRRSLKALIARCETGRGRIACPIISTLSGNEDKSVHPCDVRQPLNSYESERPHEQPGRGSVFAGSIPQIYERYLVPLIFEPYAADLALRLAAGDLRDVLEVAAGTGVVTRALAATL